MEYFHRFFSYLFYLYLVRFAAILSESSRVSGQSLIKSSGSIVQMDQKFDLIVADMDRRSQTPTIIQSIEHCNATRNGINCIPVAILFEV